MYLLLRQLFDELSDRRIEKLLHLVSVANDVRVALNKGPGAIDSPGQFDTVLVFIILDRRHFKVHHNGTDLEHIPIVVFVAKVLLL